MKLALIGTLAPLGVFGSVIAARAEFDPVASSTAVISDAGQTLFEAFIGVFPTIFLIVVSIALVLWGVRWMMSHFRGGRRS